MQRGPLVAFVTSGFCFSCASAPAPYTQSAPHREARVDVGAPRSAPFTPKEAALTVDLTGRTFPLPLVHGKVGGRPAWILLDTGANTHVVAEWLAKEIDLPREKSDNASSDHLGRSFQSYRVDALLEVDGLGTVGERATVAIAMPALFQRLGIGAILSPQRLVTSSSEVVLDFRKKLFRLGAPRGYPVNAADVAVDFPGARRCAENGESAVWVIGAHVGGYAVDLMLDTGADRTDLFEGGKAGTRLRPRSAPRQGGIYAASGTAPSRHLPETDIEIGRVKRKVDLDLLPGSKDDACPRDGVLGMDVLASCTVILRANGPAAICAP